MTEMVVYGLRDPRQPNSIRYIGQTADLDFRFSQHLAEGRNPAGVKNLWIFEIGLEGFIPEAVILETVRADDRKECRRLALDCETKWIHNHAGNSELPILNAPHWEKSMLASGVPRSTIAIYRSLSHTYATPRFSDGRRSEAGKFLGYIQRDFPQLFFRTHYVLENLIFSP